jgi:hypothetical protein
MFHRQTSAGKDQVSGNVRRKLKTKKSQSSTESLWKLGYIALPKSREAMTRVSERPRSEGNTLIKEVNPSEDQRTL